MLQTVMDPDRPTAFFPSVDVVRVLDVWGFRTNSHLHVQWCSNMDTPVVGTTIPLSFGIPSASSLLRIPLLQPQCTFSTARPLSDYRPGLFRRHNSIHQFRNATTVPAFPHIPTSLLSTVREYICKVVHPRDHSCTNRIAAVLTDL